MQGSADGVVVDRAPDLAQTFVALGVEPAKIEVGGHVIHLTRNVSR